MPEYYKKIEGSMFDFPNFYSNIANNLPDNCTIAEVGVANGQSALYLAEELKNQGKKFTFYFIDSLDYGGKDQLTIIINHVIKSKIEGIEVLPFASLEAVDKFPDNHFDFIFIDSSHLYEDTKQEIKAWYKKIKVDGILAGHDFFSHREVNRAVIETIPLSVVRPPIVNPNYNESDPSDSRYQQEFDVEKFLNHEQTDQGYGVWWIQKKFYVDL